MPEIKNTFTGGRMEKDQDERIVQNGLYREALNITVSTSEDSDVGAAQNILGNIKVTEAISGPRNRWEGCTFESYPALQGRYFGTNTHIAAIIDKETDMMYRFISTIPTPEANHGVWMDRIVEYDTNARKEIQWFKKEKSVLVDIWKVRTEVNAVTFDVNCNKTKITVCINGPQLRSGLRLVTDDILGGDVLAHIEEISYSGNNAEVTLSEDLGAAAPSVGETVTFHGDRSLNFDKERNITGVNVIDGMIFWTDNHSEPKKINIERCKKGSSTKTWQHEPEVKVYGDHGGALDAAYSDFDQHTLLVVEDELVTECNKVEITCPTPGCTDPLANNYDPSAGVDDGSCNYAPVEVQGCIDSLACNYDPNATIDDSSCRYCDQCEECYTGGGGLGNCEDVTDPTSNVYDASHPCNTDKYDCWLNWYDAVTGGSTLSQLTDRHYINSGNSYEFAPSLPGSGGTNSEAVLKEVCNDVGLHSTGFNSMWYWQFYPASAAQLNGGYETDGLCSFPATEIPTGMIPQYAIDNFNNNTWDINTYIMVKRHIGSFRLMMHTDGLNAAGNAPSPIATAGGSLHVTFPCNILNHQPGVGGVPNPFTVGYPTWEHIIWNLQQEGFDGVTLDDNGVAIPLVDTSMDWDTVTGIIHQGFVVAQDWGPWDDNSGTAPYERSTQYIKEGSNVWYTIEPNPEDSDCLDPTCSGYNATGCYLSPTGKHLNMTDCQNDGCDSSDFSSINTITYNSSSSGVVIDTYPSPFGSPLPWKSTSRKNLSNLDASEYEPTTTVVNVAQLVTGTSLVGSPLADPNDIVAPMDPNQSPFSGSLNTNQTQTSSTSTPGKTTQSSFNSVGVNSSYVANINSGVFGIGIGNETSGRPIIPRHVPDTPSVPIRGGFPGDDVEWDLRCRPVYVLEKHITVIRKGPTAPPTVEMFAWPEDIQMGSTYDDANINIETSFAGSDFPTGTAEDGTDIPAFFKSNKDRKAVGDTVDLPIDWQAEQMDWKVGQTLMITLTFTNLQGKTQKATCRAIIESLTPNNVEVKIFAITRNFPINALTVNDIYTATLELIPPLFEFKFPKFAYRYKYEDGEYSVFGPWSEIAFMPGTFDYLPKKGYNLGMVNTMRSLKLKNWRPKSMPEDVIEIDLLYKESNSPNCYTVETFKKDPKNPNSTYANNWWWGDAAKPGTGFNKGDYTITSELIHKVVPSNQLLRPWDNVPRKALAQEITANRIIFANYVQNYDVKGVGGDTIKPDFNISLDQVDYSIDSATPNVKEPMKSLKSMRTYQVGVVYRDRYGRETPVLTSNSGNIELPKSFAKLQTRLSVKMNNEAPDWAESYTFYIKETSNEYYNLAMDRWYNADDDGVWLSFPSSERNKLSERSIIMLKKEHNTDRYVDTDVKYKVLDIKNDAPTFIKTDTKYWGSIPMMLPPPGWGQGSKAGTWDTGMFHLTGLPLPNRLNLDIYAEYFDQSVLAGIMKQEDSAGVQIRMTQTIGAASAYNSTPSQSVNKSDWYDVAAINYIGAPPETFIQDSTDAAGNSIEKEVEVPGQAEQIVRISLEKLMGADMAFCEPNDNLSLSRGLSLEVRTKVVRDKSEFQGRFFAKVLRDEALTSHVVEPGTTQLEDTYQILVSRRVKYIQFGSPGVQDYMTGAAGTIGAAKGRFYNNLDYQGTAQPYNYMPIGKRWDLIPSGDFGKKYEYATFTKFHGATPYKSTATGPGLNNGAYLLPPQTAGDYFPWGPSYASNPVLVTGWFFNKYYDFLNYTDAQDYYNHTVANPPGNAAYHTAAQASVPVWPDAQNTNSYWPSMGFADWEPRTCFGGCNGMVVDFFPTGDYSIGIHTNELSVSASGGSINVDDLAGANPYMLGAIWGDQSDLLGYGSVEHGANPAIINANTGGSNSPVGYDVNIPIHSGDQSMWKKNTIEKLRENWYLLYYGRDLVDGDWPLGRFSPERWFFDKVSSTYNGCGNGIWDQDDGSGNVVSMMDLSYYGIGTTSSHHRSHDLSVHQENELAFAELMGTVGTQFRFKQDPNQTVYTITRAEITENIFNYETAYGSWAYRDADGNIKGGGNLGGGHLPPWGSSKVMESSIAGKNAFISDVFNVGCELTGGAPYNYRSRITITLDKVIGSEGVAYGSANMGFHPILNHVDENGDCNIQGGAKVYSQNTSPKGWTGFSEDIGGTPTSDAYFNLSSYWNYDNTVAAPTGQSSTKDDDAYNNGQHFGLHERGLNDTTIEIITPYRGDDAAKQMSQNPAIWETEPMEDVGLDIYYAASPTYPVNVRRFRLDENRPDPTDFANGNLTLAHYYDYGYRGEDIIPVGCQAMNMLNNQSSYVIGVQGNRIYLNTSIGALAVNQQVKFYWEGEGKWYGAEQDDQYIIAEVQDTSGLLEFRINPESHGYKRSLSYYNCYTFSNGVESNRVRDDYNAITIDKGVKASMPLAEGYEEERKGSSLIFSGIYNSTSGINRTNQFIQAEPITKDLNPVNGSIQKLHTRDTDLLTFCENKVFKILAKKDALFNADGNTNVTSNAAVLGVATPFTGEYGISRNPESFAAESYRCYFTDKFRGAVMRLSRDGLTPISDAGMKDWFKDNLYNATALRGSFDSREDHYNLTVETIDQYTESPRAYTLTYTEAKRGWESFKSFIHQQGLSNKNVYFTFPSNRFSSLTSLDPWGVPYSYQSSRNAEVYQHHIDYNFKRLVTAVASAGTTTLTVEAGTTPILPGMNISGNGIEDGTMVLTSTCNASNCDLDLSDIYGNTKKAYCDLNTEVSFTSRRNVFYEVPHYSQMKVMFNRDQGSVKRFKTINYEGTQCQVAGIGNQPMILNEITNNQYQIVDDFGVTHLTGVIRKDDYRKEGWFVYNVETDMQDGNINEFINKENKYFNYIRGAKEESGNLLDTSDFSLQGLGFSTVIDQVNPQDYYEQYPLPDQGVPSSNMSIGTIPIPNCFILGCMDPMDLNYNPDACYDDGKQCQQYPDPGPADNGDDNEPPPPPPPDPDDPRGDGVTTTDPVGGEDGNIDPDTGTPMDTNTNTSY